MSSLRCPNSVVLHFPDAVHTTVGSSEMLPYLLDTLEREKLTTVQFLRGGRVRLTFTDQASCDALISSGLTYNNLEVRVLRADSRFRSVYLRDLPSEVSDEDVKAFLQSYGEILSIHRSTFPNFPGIFNGNRVVEFALDRDIPYFVTIADFNCRVWYPGQPAHCAICRKPGHRVSSCPLSGLCRRCLQPGHMARECRRAWDTIRPGTDVLASNVPAALDDHDENYVPPEEAPSEAPEGMEDVQLMSGDEEVAASAPPPPPPPVPASVPDVPPAPVKAPPPAPMPLSAASDVLVPDVPPAPVSDLKVLTPSVSAPPPPTSSAPPVSIPPATKTSDVDPRFASSLRKLPTDQLFNLSQQDVSDFVSDFIEKHRSTVSTFNVLYDYVFSTQRKIFKKMESAKKSLKRLPAKPLETEGPPPRKPTRPDRVSSK